MMFGFTKQSLLRNVNSEDDAKRNPRGVWKRYRAYVLVAVLLLAAFPLWAFWWEPSSLQIVQDCVEVKWLYARPLRVVLLTDLHVGSPFNGIDKLRDIVRSTNRAAPDVIFILGDLVIQDVVGGSFVSPEEIGAELAGLQAASGVFAVLGNHDV